LAETRNLPPNNKSRAAIRHSSSFERSTRLHPIRRVNSVIADPSTEKTTVSPAPRRHLARTGGTRGSLNVQPAERTPHKTVEQGRAQDLLKIPPSAIIDEILIS